MEPNDSSKKPSKKPKQLNGYYRYSGLGVQMIVTMLLAAWGGRWLDNHYQMKVPVFTLVLILLAIGGMLYKFIREVMKDSGQ